LSALIVVVRAPRIAGGSVAAAATAAATPITSEWGEQIAGDQSEDRGRERQQQVLGEQHDRYQCRRAADGFEQAHPPGLFGHPAADNDCHAGDREHR
jgi:hypothetical protein